MSPWAIQAVVTGALAGAAGVGWSAVRAHRQAALRGVGRRSQAVTFDWVDVRPGTFRMGDPAAAPSADYDEHSHTVTLTRPFRLGVTPVTVDQYARFVAETGHRTDAERSGRGQGRSKAGLSWFKGMTWRKASAGLPGGTPVAVVSWHDAAAFCRWASGRSGHPVRLPTEAEWEYACRAGTTGPYNAPGPATDLGWFADNSGDHPLDGARLFQGGNAVAATALATARCRPRPVGLKRPNAWGLYDMHGNVWQWCGDAFGPYPDGPVTDPTGPADPNPRFRSARCAGWCDWPALGTSYNRGRWTPDVGYHHIGFRIAADVP